MPLDLLPPHSPLWISVAVALAVLLGAGAWYLLTGHEFWGGNAQWTTDGGENPAGDSLTTPQPITIRSGCYRFLTKEVQLPVDCFEDSDHPNFGWVQQLRERGYSGRRMPSVRFGQGATGARYVSSSGTPYTSFCERLDHPFSLLELRCPDEVEGGAGSASPSRRPKPIFLHVDTSPGEFLRRGLMPWIVLPASWLSLGAAFAVLLYLRVI